MCFKDSSPSKIIHFLALKIVPRTRDLDRLYNFRYNRSPLTFEAALDGALRSKSNAKCRSLFSRYASL